MSQTKQLATLLDRAEYVVAFTGAGISTESGIPDFRSPGGVWSKTTPVQYSDFVSSRDERVRYWKQRIEIYRDFAAASPNAGHRMLAELEKRGKLKGIITQNIDGLHQIAGSKRVIEIHGTARVVACIDCKKEWSPEAIHEMIEAGDEAPDCDACGSPLKSRTISFGQAMPEVEMQESAQLARSADLFLAIGSSLVVEPAASLPRIAKHYGATLVIINRDETPLDSMADLVIQESIGETLAAAE
jgi:NAD-dependent protein deacetylase/lipoamidase